MPPWFNVATHLRTHAEARPDQPALRYPASSYSSKNPRWDELSYRDFDRRSDAYARGFSGAGVVAGDRVLMLMKPRMDLWVVLFALFKVGAVPVLIDPGMGRRALLSCVERIGCRVVLAETAVHILRTTLARKAFAKAEVFITVGPKLWWGGKRLKHCLVEGSEPFPLAERAELDDAAIAFTSGSTGTPKGVAYHQGMWAAAVHSIRELMHMKVGDVSVQAFAAFAIYDLCWGHTAVIPKINLSKPATAPPSAMVEAIQANQANLAFASPIIWRTLQPHCERAQITLPSLDKAITTGAPTPPEMVRAYAGILRDGVEFHTPYGATEAIPVSHIGSDELLASAVQKTAKGAGTCVGHPAPGIDIRIIHVTDEDIEDWSGVTELGGQAIGEIVVSGGQVSRTYRAAPDGNASSKIKKGDQIYHRMGDLGYFDDDGRLWFCGRKSQRLQTVEGLVPSVPVEGIFNEHPSVFRSALVGVGPLGQQVPVLAVELLPPAKWSTELESELKELAENTPYAGLIRRFVPYGAFPTDARHNSKIRRGAIQRVLTPQCADLLTD